MTTPLNLHDYTGVIHLHSAYSFDGRTPVPEILTAARRCGLDFLLLTDHSTLQARADGFEGWHDGILLVVGEEIAPRFNHYLAFGHRQPVATEGHPSRLTAQITIDQVQALGGIGIIAHPDHQGTALFHVKHYPWIDWTVTGYTGLGIWDFMTDWQNGLTGYPRALLSYLFPALFLRGPSPRALARWDLLTQQGRVVGIGELDNHATRMKFLGLTLSVFPFRRVFCLIRTHLLTDTPLTGDDAADISTLLAALRNGRAYVALDHHRLSTGFSVIVAEADRSATMGDRFVLDHRAEFTVSVPHKARLRIIRNGSLFREATGCDLEIAISEPGVYRVEAALKIRGNYRPWIYSNPVYIASRKPFSPTTHQP
jgi:hypothetical protein